MKKAFSITITLMMVASIFYAADECQQSFTINITNDYDFNTVHNVCIKSFSQITFTINGVDCKTLSFVFPREKVATGDSASSEIRYYSASDPICASGLSAVTFLTSVTNKLPESAFAIHYTENNMIKALPFKIKNLSNNDKRKDTVSVIINRVNDYTNKPPEPANTTPATSTSTESQTKEIPTITEKTEPTLILSKEPPAINPTKPLIDYYLNNILFLAKDIEYSNDTYELKVTSLISTLDKSYLYLFLKNTSEYNITLDSAISDVAYNTEKNPLSFYKWDCKKDAILPSTSDICVIEFDKSIPPIFTIDIITKDENKITFKRPIK